jgi:tryptophan halogenase
MALQTDRNIGRITIVGGGTTGCLTALHLTKTFPDKSITWIYPEENEPIGVGEAIVPDVSKFLANLGVSHKDIIRECKGSIKLGIRFENFNGTDDVFNFPFGVGEEGDPRFNSAQVEYMMESDKIPNNIFEYTDVSTHFRALEVLTFLERTVDQYPNITIKRTTVTKEELEGTYDLLIDATGFKRHISMIPDNFVPLKDKIPNNKALVFRHPYTDKQAQLKPYTTIRAMDYGWMWHIPLKDQLAIGYVHDDRYDVKQDFITHIEKKMNITVDPNSIGQVHMLTGRNKIHLKDNIIAIGLASAFIEPLESTGLYLVTSSLRKVEKYINGIYSEDDYNTAVNADVDAIIDFIIAHYKYSKRSNTYWDSFKDISIELYRKIDIFTHSSWDYVLNGFLPEIKKPLEPIDIRERINIAKGTPYKEWIENEQNFTCVQNKLKN